MKFIFNMLFNVWFYVGVIGVIVIIYFFPGASIGSWQLPSFPAFHFASNKTSDVVYVPKRTISNMIIGVTYAGVTIGNKSYTSSSSTSFDNDFEAMIETKSSIISILNRDLIQLLDNSTDRSRSLQSFIGELENLNEQAEGIYRSAGAKVNERQANYDSCTSSKNAVDVAYLNAINQGDASDIEGLLQQAEEYGQCQTNMRIRINSYLLPLQELKTVRDASSAYIQNLYDNFENLVTYYDILRDDVLQGLIQTKQLFGL